jgi:polyribonucleotide nucleotidyltransferase
MDIKVRGLTYEVLERALMQAREGRLFILDKMDEAIAAPRGQLSPYAPKMARFVVPVEKIGAIIGPGGRVIRAIQEELDVNIEIQDDGVVFIAASSDEMIKRATERVDGLTREIAVGDIFTGKVMRMTSFGAFVEMLPGKEGLVRLSDLGDVEEDLDVGQEITVVVQEIDSMGRINLSRRALFGDSEAGNGPAARPPRPAGARPPPRPGGGGGPPFDSRGPGPGPRQGGDRRPPPRPGGGPNAPRSGPGPGQSRRPPPPRSNPRGLSR